jgi:hypothetical protein
MELESEGPEVDDVLLQLLLEKAKQGRLKRAEKVMAPQQEAAPVEGAPDDEMAELEAMLAEEGGETQSGPCETCGKGPDECAC